MRMNISVPDDLAAQVRELKLPISTICQNALSEAVKLGADVDKDARLGALIAALVAEAATRRVELEGQMLVELITAIFTDQKIGLSAKQLETLWAVTPGHLREITWKTAASGFEHPEAGK